MVSDTDDKDANNAIGFAVCRAKKLFSPAQAREWRQISGVIDLRVWTPNAPPVFVVQPTLMSTKDLGQCTIRIKGVIGPNKPICGRYRFVGRLNGRPLYQHEENPDLWLRFAPDKTWMVSNTKNKDDNSVEGWAFCVGEDYPDPSYTKKLVVYNGRAWQAQATASLTYEP